MSNTEAIRDALKGASGALTTAELADLAEIERGDAAKLLYAMTQTGEVIKEDGVEGGKPTYLRNPDFKPKRQAAAEPESAPKAGRAKRTAAKKATPATRRAKPKAERKPKRVPRKAARKAAPAPAQAAAAAPAQALNPRLTSELQRAVRLLVAHAMRGDEALDADTREAVLIVLPEVA
jgi:hypothetical protein